ncbi:MAG TPA: hypothetical protein DCZ10_18290 [Pelotomaculum sp.]|nr:hypothetical protein [Pelotomaculum sp.]
MRRSKQRTKLHIAGSISTAQNSKAVPGIINIIVLHFYEAINQVRLLFKRKHRWYVVTGAPLQNTLF